MCLKLVGCCLVLCVLRAVGQDSHAPNDRGDRAVREFRNNDWSAAERDFREIVKREPSNILAWIYLGQTLFRQERYRDAAVPLQKARDVEKSGQELSTAQDRILTDQLVMSYGVSGDLPKTHPLLNEAIARDPDYPLNYYNLACAHAKRATRQEPSPICNWPLIEKAKF